MSNIEHIDGLTINESDYKLEYGKTGRIAVIMYVGSADPKAVLDYAVSLYVGNNQYHQLIDAHLDNPWMRVILSDINSMKQEKFVVGKHQIDSALGW